MSPICFSVHNILMIPLILRYYFETWPCYLANQRIFSLSCPLYLLTKIYWSIMISDNLNMKRSNPKQAITSLEYLIYYCIRYEHPTMYLRSALWVCFTIISPLIHCKDVLCGELPNPFIWFTCWTNTNVLTQHIQWQRHPISDYL